MEIRWARPAGLAVAAGDLRSDQEQEFQENPNTACARGAPDCVRFAMPAGLLSENGYNSEN